MAARVARVRGPCIPIGPAACEVSADRLTAAVAGRARTIAGERAEIARAAAIRGPITVDGISLTVSALGDDWFEVSLIPTTRELTTLGPAQAGDPVNLEVDVIAKYVERLMTHK